MTDHQSPLAGETCLDVLTRLCDYVEGDFRPNIAPISNANSTSIAIAAR